MKINFTVLICILFAATNLNAQQNFWSPVEEDQLLLPEQAELLPTAEKRQLLQLDFQSLKTALINTPVENQSGAAFQLALPMPDGSFQSVSIVESSVMTPELAAKFPEIKSYLLTGLEDRSIRGRFDCTFNGFNAYFNTAQGDVFVSPIASGQQRYYAAYFAKDIEEQYESNSLACGYSNPAVDHISMDETLSNSPTEDVTFRNNAPIELRVYTVALACTGEYAQNHGGTVESVMSSFNTAMNTINVIFENEVAVRLMLMPNNEQLIYLNPGTDPYLNSNDAEDLLDQNTNVIVNVAGIPLSVFDIGHVFTAGCINGLGGIAGGTTCNTNKGRGVTCHFSNNVSYIAREIMAHELAHQFSVSHSWNNCPNSLDQLASGWAYEPGSGSTIMSYSGSCGTQDIQSNSDDYYSVGSLQQFITYSRQSDGDGCATHEPTNNNEPSVSLDYTDGFYIPINTPFELNATGSDPDGDEITFCWEQFDLGPVSPLGMPMANAPLFRSYPPRASSKRIFPRMQTIVSNSVDLKEFLPTYNRDMTFRCTVRDNHPGAGGTVWETVEFEATQSAGPFLVTSPNNGTEEWTVGDYVEVTWDVANTDNNKVNCKFVNILLSTDGGFNYPIVLEANVPNDGSQFITVPDNVANNARIRIEAANNIFFDISNNNFDIVPATDPGYTLDLSEVARIVCLPETVEVDLNSGSILDFNNSIELEIIDGVPADATANLSANSITPGESSTLSIEMPESILTGTYEVLIQVVSEGIDTSYRTLTLIAQANVFDDLSLALPVDGTTGIEFSTDFEWMPSINAEYYEFELATSPTFGNTIVETFNVFDSTTYTPSILFEENTIYYWRVRPVNSCGTGENINPFSFQTQSVICVPSQADDVPITISGTGTPTVESEIFIEQDGIISDINLPFFKGSYQPVNSIRLSLISPAGTEVILFDQNCGNTLKIEMGFDDDAPNEIICPPDDGIIFKPVEPLSTFIGEGTQGTWTLRADVIETGFGGGGAIEQWNLEFCASFTPTNPFLITNDTLYVPPAEFNTITQEILEVQDEVNSPEQLTYTIIAAPEHGTLFLAGIPLEVGSTFRQSSINFGNVSYLHDGSDTELDHFLFTVTDGEGGWLSTQQFNIKIDEDAVVSTENLFDNNQVWVFPIPADESLNISFESPVTEDIQIRLLNIHGQTVWQSRIASFGQTLEIPTRILASGAYAISLESANNLLVKKIIIQH